MSNLAARILELRHQDMTFPEIAERLNMALGSVHHIVKKLRAAGVDVPSQSGARSIWTQERLDDLRRFHAEGDAASVVAQKLGHGLSRSAVLGKLHRLGLTKPGGAARTPVQGLKRDRRTSPGHEPRQAAHSHPVRLQAPFELGSYEAERRANGAVPFLDMRYFGQCKFFLQGESGCHGLVCAAPTDVTERYCETHKAVSMASQSTFVEAAE